MLQFISDLNVPSRDEEFAMLTRLVRDSGRPLSLSLGQRHSAPDGWRRLLDLTEAANAQGLPITAQVAPWPIGVLLGLQGSLNPFSACRGYRAIAGLPLAGRLALLQPPALRLQLLAELQDLSIQRDQQRDPLLPHFDAFDRVHAFGDPPDDTPPAEQSGAAIAARLGVSPAWAACDLMLGAAGRAFLFAPFANPAEAKLDVCHEMLAHRHRVPGLGDGGAHVSIISDGCFPTYLLSHWGRDRAKGRFDIGWLVRGTA